MAGSPSMLAAELPDAILLDLMPEMDGFELVVALQAKAAWREIPVGRRYRARPNGGRPEAAQQRRANLMKHAFPLAELVARVCALFDTGEKPRKRA